MMGGPEEHPSHKMKWWWASFMLISYRQRQLQWALGTADMPAPEDSSAAIFPKLWILHSFALYSKVFLGMLIQMLYLWMSFQQSFILYIVTSWISVFTTAHCKKKKQLPLLWLRWLWQAIFRILNNSFILSPYFGKISLRWILGPIH